MGRRRRSGLATRAGDFASMPGMDLELTGKRAHRHGRQPRHRQGGSRRRCAAKAATSPWSPETRATPGGVCAELATASGRRVVPLVADTGDRRVGAGDGAAAADALGGVDILVNCAARPAGQAPPPEARRHHRRRCLGRHERQGDGLPPLRPGRRPADGRAGLGPHHQRLRARRPLHRVGHRVDPQRRRRRA